MSDGYIGLIRFQKDFSIPKTLIRGLSVSINESISKSGIERNLSIANITISGLNVVSGKIAYINIYKEKIDDESSLLIGGESIPSDWTLIHSQNVNLSAGLHSDIEISVGGIPSHPHGYYHKFMIEFLDENHEEVSLYPTEKDFSCTINEDTIYFDEQDFSFDSLIGGKINIYANGQNIYPSSQLIKENSNTSIQFYKFSESKNYEEDAEITFEFYPSSKLIYISNSGKGYLFNGINDFTEIANVLKLLVESYTIPEGGVQTAGWYNSNGILSNNFAHLKWENMFDHITIESHPHIDGENRKVTRDMWKNITTYIIFAYISEDNTSPSTNPSNDTNWKPIAELPASHKSPSIQPYIEYTINNLPRNKYISFYVGAMTSTTKTNIELKIVDLL